MRVEEDNPFAKPSLLRNTFVNSSRILTYMLHTERCKLLVTEVCEQHISVQVLSGHNSGRDVDLPKEHDAYPSSVESCLCSDLDHGMIVDAALVSEHEENPDWRIDELYDYQAP